MTPNSFVISIGNQPSIITSNESGFSEAPLITQDLNPRFIKYRNTEDGFLVFIGEAHSHDSKKDVAPAGTTISYNDHQKTLTIECDRLGTAIVYWTHKDGTFSVSNRLENLITKDSSPDWSSIQQYLHTGFTIRDSTFYKQIYQTEENSTIQATLRDGVPKLKFSKHDASTPGKKSTDVVSVIDDIGDQLSYSLKRSHPSVLMMSAGWDSRTLLIEREANILGAYTHGDLSSREIHLAQKLSGNERLDHLFTDIESCPLNNALIDRMLYELGFAVFPVWYIAAQNIRGWKDVPLMSGVLGELMGGHYGLMSWGSRSQKLLSSFLFVDESLIGEERFRSMIDQYASPPSTHWFVSRDGQSMLDEHRGETKQKVLDAVDAHYRETGNWQSALEDFNMSHRARQYILKQAQAASSTVGYTLPYADHQLTDLVRSVNYNHRVHNKVNRRVLKRKHPGLLNEPMAATLIAAKHPILVQEMSRCLRVLRESTAKKLRAEGPRLGWFNYEHLYQGNTLHEITDSLKSPIWDKEKMHRTLRNNPDNKIDAGSTLDMLCKVKTVDHYLSMEPTV